MSGNSERFGELTRAVRMGALISDYTEALGELVAEVERIDSSPSGCVAVAQLNQLMCLLQCVESTTSSLFLVIEAIDRNETGDDSDKTTRKVLAQWWAENQVPRVGE